MAKRGLVVLARVPIFQGLSRRQLRRIQDVAKEVHYHDGHTIVREGEEGDSMFVIVEGEAKVIRGKRTITHLVPGDFFGEISLLDGGSRTATVSSETPMTLLEIYRKDFNRIASHEPAIAAKMLTTLAIRLREIERPLAG